MKDLGNQNYVLADRYCESMSSPFYEQGIPGSRGKSGFLYQKYLHAINGNYGPLEQIRMTLKVQGAAKTNSMMCPNGVTAYLGNLSKAPFYRGAALPFE